MTQDSNEKKFMVLPNKQLLTMAVISLIVTYALHRGVIGNSSSVAMSAAVALAIGVVAVAFLVSLVPAGIYWFARRARMPGLAPLVWIVWAGSLSFVALRIIRIVKGG